MRLLKIGTRGSPLALFQANAVRDALLELGNSAFEIQITEIRTTGDKVRDRPLAELGGKGLFTKEIEAALLANEIDLAVHSTKDVPTWLPEGLHMAGYLPREDVRDVLISRAGAKSIQALPEGSVVGTVALRRKAQLLALRPDLQITMLRGNVETRLKKVEDGDVDATLLAYAGVRRLGLGNQYTHVIEPEDVVPSAGQGAIGIEVCAQDQEVRSLIEKISHGKTERCVTAERAFLDSIDGTCQSPVGAWARYQNDDQVAFDGIVLSEDGTRIYRSKKMGPPEDVERLARSAAEDIRAQADPAFWRAFTGKD